MKKGVGLHCANWSKAGAAFLMSMKMEVWKAGSLDKVSRGAVVRVMPL